MTIETLIVGIIFSLLFVEMFGLYPGGIIVPAYIALYLDRPLMAATTFGVAVICLLSFKVLSRFLLLFGRRRFVIFLLLGIFWSQVWHLVFPHLFAGNLELKVIGWLIPGLLANNLEKQEFVPTVTATLTVSILTYFFIRIISPFLQ